MTNMMLEDLQYTQRPQAANRPSTTNTSLQTTQKVGQSKSKSPIRASSKPMTREEHRLIKAKDMLTQDDSLKMLGAQTKALEDLLKNQQPRIDDDGKSELSKYTISKNPDEYLGGPSGVDIRRNLIIESPFELFVKSPSKFDGEPNVGSVGDYSERLQEEIVKVSREKDREIGDLRTEYDIMRKERDFEKKLAFDE
jgi:hypothetical protein